jgi:hypothetical protein
MVAEEDGLGVVVVCVLAVVDAELADTMARTQDE